MDDTEKVIKGLEMCKIDFCDACPYDDEKPCTLALKQDALDLIEEMRNKISELNLIINHLTSGNLTSEVDELMYQHKRSKNCEVT